MSLYSRYFTPRQDPGLVTNGQAFAMYLDSPTLADTNEDNLLLLNNATSATQLVVYVRRLQSRATYRADLRFYAAPTVTGAGSVATPVNRKIGGAASAMTVSTGPTTSSKGTLIDVMSSFSFAPSEANDSPIVVPAGTKLLVTVQGSNTGALVLAGLDWVEVP